MQRFTALLKQLKEERARLDAAIRSIESLSRSEASRTTGSRRLSDAARRRIALAQKKRWVAWRKSKKKA